MPNINTNLQISFALFHSFHTASSILLFQGTYLRSIQCKKSVSATCFTIVEAV